MAWVRGWPRTRLISSNPTNDRNPFCIPRFYWPGWLGTGKGTCKWPPLLVRQQRIAYAITFNSCQGLTLDRVALNLRSDVFAHGKLYTVVSRFRNRSCIRRLMPGDTTNGEYFTANIVHKGLLLGA